MPYRVGQRRAHQRDGGGAAERAGVTEAEEDRGRPGIVEQASRPRRCSAEEHADAEPAVPLPAEGDVVLGGRRATRTGPGHRGRIRRQQVAQGRRTDGGHRGERDGVGLLGQGNWAPGGHGATTSRPARSDSASDTCANDTTSSAARSATVCATRDALCNPRALRAPAWSFEESSSFASGASRGRAEPPLEPPPGRGPAREPARARAAATRSATTAEGSPAFPERSSPGSGRLRGTTRSKRSSSGAEIRRR